VACSTFQLYDHTAVPEYCKCDNAGNWKGVKLVPRYPNMREPIVANICTSDYAVDIHIHPCTKVHSIRLCVFAHTGAKMHTECVL